VENTVAYYDTELTTTVKSFIVKTPVHISSFYEFTQKHDKYTFLAFLRIIWGSAIWPTCHFVQPKVTLKVS